MMVLVVLGAVLGLVMLVWVASWTWHDSGEGNGHVCLLCLEDGGYHDRSV